MLPPALVRAADRLTDVLMQLASAVGRFGTDPATPDAAAEPARTLFLRLTYLVIRLVRLSNNPALPILRQPADDPDATPAAEPPAPQPTTAPTPRFCLPRHPGWLLALLPDDAPALAAALRDALADPALLPLLAAAPTLARELRPILRALDLDAPLLDVPPPRPPHPEPPPSLDPPPPAHTPLPTSALKHPSHPTPTHAQYVPHT